MDCLACTIIGLSGSSFLLCMWYWMKGRRLPPGPVNFFGHFYSSNTKEVSRYFLELKDKYGPVCCIRVLGTPCIYLNTHDKIRQCYVNLGDVTSARLSFTGVKHRLTAGRGVIFNDGESWQEHRRFALSTLRDFGFGKGGAEQIVQNELTQLVDEFVKHGGQPVDPQFALNIATCNVISSLVFGERCGNEAGFKPIHDIVQQSIGTIGLLHEVVLYYALRLGSLLPSFVALHMLKVLDQICDYYESKIKRHSETFNGEIRDLLDAYLQELKSPSSANTKKYFDEPNLKKIIDDLFLAGIETTASTLRWALFLMARHPFVQQRVFAELDEVLQGRMPSTADRKQLPYVDAVLMEVQRFATLTPLGALPHRVSEQFSLDGYTIPKDALMFANLFAAHRDTSVWPHPFEFNPDNFYHADTKSTRNAELLIPFGVGRRSCLGESLAKQELFVFFSGVMQEFELRPSSDERFPTEDECLFGRFRVTASYKVNMIKRSVESIS